MSSSTTRAQDLLLEYLRDHDANCPVCGYNVRALTRAICPECKQELAITVGVTRLGIGLLLMALVPGFFCGIAACLLAIPTTAISFEDGIVVWPFVGTVVFGWCSGLFALMLAFRGRNRVRFIAQPRRRQKRIVLLIWLIHFVAGLVFFAWVASEI